MKNRSNYALGILLIVAGLILLLMRFANFHLDWQTIWPLFMIGGGLFLFSQMGKDKGAVFPGTIVAGIGILFLLHNANLTPRMDVMWPFFPIIVGFAFVMLYFFDKRDSGVLVPASVLLIVGAVFLSINMGGYLVYIAPVGIILIGILIVSRGFMRKETHRENIDEGRIFEKSSKPEDTERSEEIHVNYINEDEENFDNE